MGDATDHLLEQMLFGPDEDEPYETSCNRCGATGLTWGNDGRSWYLITHSGDAHVCSEEGLRRQVLDEFEAFD